MGVTEEICRKTTSLSLSQIEKLQVVESILELASDIAYAQITIYAKSDVDHYLVIIAQAKPNTGFIQYRPNLLGTTVYASEEPLVWRTFESGENISGQREWALGMDALEMRTYPICDDTGTIIAVASFEASFEETSTDHPILVHTAYQLLISCQVPALEKVYRPLTARDGIMIIDERGLIIAANAATVNVYKILGIGKIVGRKMYDRQLNIRLAQKAAHVKQPQETEWEIGNMILAMRAIPIVTGDQVGRTIVILADVTELKKKEKELLIKSAVIQEIHHRVKNNLQTVASLLRLQARRSNSMQVKAALRESINRILSISVVHEFLSQQDKEIIDVAEVVKNILDLVIQNMLEPDFNIQTVFNGQTVILPSEQATSLALAVNELIQNSLEHGFVGLSEGVIGIDIVTTKDFHQVDIYDNGIGLPPDFNPQNSRSLGLQIVRKLIEDDLGGQFRIYSDSGTRASITVPRVGEGG
ncbi:sensor histidine kinase [Acetonema longum]|uniref:histidine kinase n=1 Tax=Acetonema longum DSM 6540 TaxID=1009370 RepID=F7NI46_9FIRM|nr:histidine kinase N-terminal domain-containing protein [Acetonema longum]EGO64278.1 two-component sensor histidine kinase [Acetonema longum DSM 6540]